MGTTLDFFIISPSLSPPQQKQQQQQRLHVPSLTFLFIYLVCIPPAAASCLPLIGNIEEILCRRVDQMPTTAI